MIFELLAVTHIFSNTAHSMNLTDPYTHHHHTQKAISNQSHSVQCIC